MSTLRFVWSALLIAAASCTAEGAAPVGEWHEDGEHRWRTLTDHEGPAAGFTRMDPRRSRITFENGVPDAVLLENRVLGNGSGVTLADYDGDGWTDIFFASVSGSIALYRNRGNWRFDDVTEPAGLTRTNRRYTGTSFADMDGDGDPDLLIASVDAPLTMYRNEGDGTFVDGTAGSGLENGDGGSTLALADVEGDGDLDLYVSTYKRKFAADILPPQKRAVDQILRSDGDVVEVLPEYREHYRVTIDREAGLVIKSEQAEPDRFYLNDGSGRFTRVSLTSGDFLQADGRPLAEEPREFGLAARFHDVNGDGAPDLYVCNDFEHPDRLWINDGSGRFRQATGAEVRATSFSSMGVDFSDVDRNGAVDIFVVDMLSRDERRRKVQLPPVAPLPNPPGEGAGTEQIPQNTLLVSHGDGTFSQVADLAGLAASEWSWTPIFMDADLDGYEDVFVSAGYRWDAINADVLETVKLDVTGVPWQEEMTLYPPLPVPNSAFRNNGDLTFSDVSEAWAFGTEEDIAQGMAAGDLDGDGDLDLVLNRWGSPAALFRNESGRPRIAVRLRGTPPNTQGVGARIEVLGGPVPVQSKEVSLGGHYLSSSDPIYAFAAGDAERLEIVVTWRDGSRTRIEDASPGRLYEIRQAPGAPSPGARLRAPEAQTPMFSDATERLAGHAHAEDAFDDYRRQPLLPNLLSRGGPGLAWADVDRDGREDLLVGGGSASSPALLRNGGSSFRAAPLGAEGMGDQAGVLLVHTRSGARALVGISNYENGGGMLPTGSAPQVLSFRLPGGASEPLTPSDTVTVGPLAAADVDRDGDLDLFAGARTLPGRYPLSAPSRLVHLEDGSPVAVEESGAFADLGMVSGAVFSDLDGDGDPDLVVATEWGPLRLLYNEGGAFQDRTAALRLDSLAGRWHGVATGDFNEDGRPDIVATGWGRNLRPVPQPDRPLLLYAGDFDRDGVIDPVLAQHAPHVGAPAPSQSLARLGVAMPAARRRVGTHERFADADVATVLGPRIAEATVLEARTYAHLLLLSGPGGYEVRELPREAQFTAAFGAVVADFDGDGHEDLFLAQNFFATEPGAPRLDGGRGLLLLGDGRGGLEPLEPSVSGIRIIGEQRGAAAADYDGDGRVDLAVAQNGGMTRLLRNERGEPGLRVRLVGPPENPDAVGASIRAIYGSTRGPLREIQAGSGYWSQNSAIQIVARPSALTGLHIRWPDGREVEVPVAAPSAAEERVIRFDAHQP